MLTYDLERRGDLPRYDYLYRCIKGDILSGRLAAGEKLPSKRALAAHLGTAVVTVENAYAQLLAEGYLTSRERSGCYVAQVETRQSPPPPPAPVQTAPERRWLLDLRGVGSGIEGFPFSVWAKLTRRVLTERGPALLRAVPHSGVSELRRALARHLYELRGIRVSPEQIVVGAGAEYLYNLLVQLLGRERVYGLEDPGYSKAGRVYALNEAECRFLPVDGAGVPPEALEGSGVQVLHLSPNHQFPTGAVTPISRRQAMLRWAQAGDRYLIEDDYDSEFRFSGLPIPALQSLDSGERVVYLNTFAKSLAPSLRIGYMVLPPHLAERYRREFLFYSSTVPSFEQYTLAQFLEGGHFERHIARMRVEYRDRKAALAAGVRDLGIPGTLSGGDAGLHMLLRMDSRLGEAELVRRAAEAGVAVYPLSSCRLTPAPEGEPPTLIMGYARLEAGDIRRALLRLREAWG